jgi:hypothetical protein
MRFLWIAIIEIILVVAFWIMQLYKDNEWEQGLILRLKKSQSLE